MFLLRIRRRHGLQLYSFAVPVSTCAHLLLLVIRFPDIIPLIILLIIPLVIPRIIPLVISRIIPLVISRITLLVIAGIIFYILRSTIVVLVGKLRKITGFYVSRLNISKGITWVAKG